MRHGFATALGAVWRRPAGLPQGVSGRLVPRIVSPFSCRSSSSSVKSSRFPLKSLSDSETASFRGTAGNVSSERARDDLLMRSGSGAHASISQLPSVKKKVTGRFGIEFFGGRRPFDTTYQWPDPPKEPYNPLPYKLEFAKYPGLASGLGAEYYLREGRKHPLTYYHMRSKLSGDTIAVGATSPRAREARSIDNYVKERTRGFAVQLILEGRGVKAYFEPNPLKNQNDDPKPPLLKVRLGVGAKVQDLSDYCTRDPDCEVSVNKLGNLMVVHGPTKSRVGTLAFRLLRRMQPILQPYTGKGAHVAHHAVRRKAVRKK